MHNITKKIKKKNIYALKRSDVFQITIKVKNKNQNHNLNLFIR